jgi:hypothetical protein
VTVWQGEAVIDSVSSECNAIRFGVRIHSVVKTVLRPRSVSNNGADTLISFIVNDIAMFAMTLPNGAMPAATAVTSGHNSSGEMKPHFSSPYSEFVQSPATIVAGTVDATLSGRINHFLFVPNCEITFRAAYSKRTT